MRKVLAFILILAAMAAAAPGAGAESLYRGHGPGIRVEFRVKDGEVTFARVRTVLHCIRDGHRIRVKLGKSLGPAEISSGRFENAFGTEEPGYSQEWLMTGGVHPQEITGLFWYQHYYQHHSVCQTRNYQSLPIRHLGRDSLRFWATRRPVHSRVRH